MKFRFLPEEFNFFNLFDKQAELAVEAAALFKELVTLEMVDAATLTRMQEIEHKGDLATHQVIDHLNKTFITPFDREDIHKLATQLDDVVDVINTIVGRLRLYKLGSADKDLAEFANVIEESVLKLASAVKGLRKLKDAKSIMESCVEINRLENVGDAMRDRVLMDLFEREKDAITVIKWKEIYQDAETVLDVCEDVANVVESILVKQA
ncbi:MAG: phosphate transport regulator [Candidatus Krumholzibacteriota bacterium]|nr:phosphate transport regulator [Candidatus Krumholzibacteriota bacterium]